MKKLSSILIMMMVALVSLAQCPDSTSVNGGNIELYYLTAPHAATASIEIDSLDGATTNTYSVSVSSSTVTIGSNTYTLLSGAAPGGVTSNSNYEAIRYYNNGGNPVGVSCNTAGSLPVDLVSFTATRVNGEVVIKWVTASEYDADYFTLYKNDNPIATTQCTNTSELVEYEYRDVENDRAVYHLTQTDNDGTVTVYGRIKIGGVEVEETPVYQYKGNFIGQEDEDGNLIIKLYRDRTEKIYRQ